MFFKWTLVEEKNETLSNLYFHFFFQKKRKRQKEKKIHLKKIISCQEIFHLLGSSF